MNRLAAAGDAAWRLAPHAHVIVHETSDGNEFITIYDCGAAQKPPSAQLIGNLVRVDADHDLLDQPTGYIAKLREESMLVRQDDDHWIVRGRRNPDSSSG